MKAQTLFIAASAFIGAFAAPVQKRDAQPDVMTIYENVVHVVTTTSTVWVPPTQPTRAPEKKVEEVKVEKPKVEEPKVEEEPVEEEQEEEEEVPAPSPTSVYIPPTPTAAPTQTKAAEPTKAPASSPAPAPEPVEEEEEKEASTPERQESAGGDVHTGEGTFYTPAMGSCGSDKYTEQDLVAALPKAVMEAVEGGNPNSNPLCGRNVEVTRGSKKVQVIVVDKCMGCAPDDIDLSPAAFNQLGEPDEGRIEVSWSLL